MILLHEKFIYWILFHRLDEKSRKSIDQLEGFSHSGDSYWLLRSERSDVLNVEVTSLQLNIRKSLLVKWCDGKTLVWYVALVYKGGNRPWIKLRGQRETTYWWSRLVVEFFQKRQTFLRHLPGRSRQSKACLRDVFLCTCLLVLKLSEDTTFEVPLALRVMVRKLQHIYWCFQGVTLQVH